MIPWLSWPTRLAPILYLAMTLASSCDAPADSSRLSAISMSFSADTTGIVFSWFPLCPMLPQPPPVGQEADFVVAFGSEQNRREVMANSNLYAGVAGYVG